MDTHRQLIAVDIPTRAVAGLAGVSRVTATRKPRVPLPLAALALVPAISLVMSNAAGSLRW